MSDLSAPLIECRGLIKRYTNTIVPVEVLKGVDLTVDRGDMIAVVGVSGVGKTTLLYVMGLMERPTGGTILFEGEDVFKDRNDVEISKFRNRSIGFVFQFHHLIPEFDVVENVMMPAIIAGDSQREARNKSMEALKNLGVEHRADHKPGEISGGEQQRVAVARAVVMNPKVVLADEPTGNLDHETSIVMHEEFMRLNEEMGVTFVIVTHNEQLAAKMKKIVRLSDGKAISTT